MKKPQIKIEERYLYICPICECEYDWQEDAEECLNECYKIEIEIEKQRQEKEALAPLKGQFDMFGDIVC